MPISDRVKEGMFVTTDPHQRDQLIRIQPSRVQLERVAATGKGWTEEEHERFLEALDRYPSGPWRLISDYIGTKTARQAMTHAQKYRHKIARRKRGLKITIHDEKGQPITSPWLSNEAQEEAAISTPFIADSNVLPRPPGVSVQEHAAITQFFMDGYVVDLDDLSFLDLDDLSFVDELDP